jgi:hypothetical protein
MLGTTITFNASGEASSIDGKALPTTPIFNPNPNPITNAVPASVISNAASVANTAPDYSSYDPWNFNIVNPLDLRQFVTDISTGFQIDSNNSSTTTDKSSQVKAKDVIGLVAISAILLLVATR